MYTIIKNIDELKNRPGLVLGIFEKSKLDSEHYQPYFSEKVKDLLQGEAVSTKLGNVTTIYPSDNKTFDKIHFIGLGPQVSYSLKKLEEASRKINYKLGTNLAIDASSFENNGLKASDVLKTLVMTVDFYNYQYLECKSKPETHEFNVAYLSGECPDAFNGYLVVAGAVQKTRDLINKPYNYLNVDQLADYCCCMVERLKALADVSIRIITREECEKMGMNAFLGVNKGSDVPAKLMYLSYHGCGNDDTALTIVGKGLMYDTGGYSLKQNMNDMKDDMGGAATAISVFEAAVLNKLPVNLNVVVAATDNRINGKALLPDDVLTAMNGKTIEIVSTDAEGRLTLADALCFAQKEGAKVVVDIATLTGAVVVALGEYTTGLFANDQNLAERMLKSAENENESLWQLPITDYIRKQVRGSKVADLTNSTGRNMGASSAAAFLEEFVEPTTKWVHLDIAGTVFHTSPAFEEFYGATGVMVRTLYNFLANYKN